MLCTNGLHAEADANVLRRVQQAGRITCMFVGHMSSSRARHAVTQEFATATFWNEYEPASNSLIRREAEATLTMSEDRVLRKPMRKPERLGIARPSKRAPKPPTKPSQAFQSMPLECASNSPGRNAFRSTWPIGMSGCPTLCPEKRACVWTMIHARSKTRGRWPTLAWATSGTIPRTKIRATTAKGGPKFELDGTVS